jgi:hypothetical protein
MNLEEADGLLLGLDHGKMFGLEPDARTGWKL